MVTGDNLIFMYLIFDYDDGFESNILSVLAWFWKLESSGK